MYLTLLLSLSTMSVLSSGVVMNMIHQDDTRPIPRYLRGLLCCRVRQIRQRLKQQRRRLQLDHDQSFHNGDFVLAKKRRPPLDGSAYVGEGRRLLEDLSHRHSNAHIHGHGHSHVNHGVFNSDGGVGVGVGVGVGGNGGGGGGGSEKENHHLRAAAESSSSSPRFFDDVIDGDVDYDAWNYITWLDVGSTIDTVLFWVFLIITVSSTTTVLLLFSY